MIYTSYYANLKKVPSDFIPIQVSNSSPIEIRYKWKNVYPSWRLVSDVKNGLITQDEYERKYIDELNNLDFDLMKWALSEMYYSPKTYLLCCYENPDKFCHRHILANYLNNKFGFLIKEYIIQNQSI